MVEHSISPLGSSGLELLRSSCCSDAMFADHRSGARLAHFCDVDRTSFGFDRRWCGFDRIRVVTKLASRSTKFTVVRLGFGFEQSWLWFDQIRCGFHICPTLGVRPDVLCDSKGQTLLSTRTRFMVWASLARSKLCRSMRGALLNHFRAARAALWPTTRRMSAPWAGGLLAQWWRLLRARALASNARSRGEARVEAVAPCSAERPCSPLPVALAMAAA